MGIVAHIEDLVVHYNYRNTGIGRSLIKYVINKSTNCYKIILDTSEELISFYNNFGFKKKNIQMAIYN